MKVSEAGKRRRSRDEALWKLVREQHGVITRSQLLELGIGREAVAWRLRSGRLHAVQRGVYAVGRPSLSRHGQWAAVVMSCGPHAALSHRSAAALYEIVDPPVPAEVTVPLQVLREAGRPRVSAPALGRRVRDSCGIRVTTVVRTLLDLAQVVTAKRLVASINAADKHDLVDPETLRSALDRYAGRRGLRGSSWSSPPTRGARSRDLHPHRLAARA